MRKENLQDLNPREQQLSIPSMTSGDMINNIDDAHPAHIWWYLDELVRHKGLGKERKRNALKRALNHYSERNKSAVVETLKAYIDRL